MAKGTAKAWAKLRVAGIRTSKERVRRLMREHDLQAPHRVGHAHGPKAHDGTITTEAPDAMWGTDMTATMTVGEGAAFVFVAVDHCTTECIGLHAAKRGNRFEALEPIRQGVRERFGAIGKGVAHGLRLRHDHGSNYLADDFQQEVAFFGIESSPSFVREPEGRRRWKQTSGYHGQARCGVLEGVGAGAVATSGCGFAAYSEWAAPGGRNQIPAAVNTQAAIFIERSDLYKALRSSSVSKSRTTPRF